MPVSLSHSLSAALNTDSLSDRCASKCALTPVVQACLGRDRLWSRTLAEAVSVAGNDSVLIVHDIIKR